MKAQAYTSPPQIFQAPNVLQANINQLASIELDWDTATINTINGLSVINSQVVQLTEGFYDASCVMYFETTSNRLSLTLQFTNGGIGNEIGPIGAGSYTRTNGGVLESGVFVRHLIAVPSGTTADISVAATRTAAAGNAPTVAGTSELLIIKL